MAKKLRDRGGVMRYNGGMKNPELMKTIDFILNRASGAEMEVIISAISRRKKGGGVGGGGMNIGNMSKNIARTVEQQLSVPAESIRKTVRDMVIKMIRQQVPDIPEEHMQALLKEWMPADGGASREEKSNLPPDVLVTMVKQFIKYSTNTMSAQEQIKLKQSMPDWPDQYWKNFPTKVRGLVTAFMNGEVEDSMFWEALYYAAGVKQK